MNLCFIITSCIYPSTNALTYSKIRSVFTPEERMEQTIHTINSIKEYCPKAYIIFTDNGLEEPVKVKTYVDCYIYIGKRPIAKIMSSTKNKSLGEWILLEYALRKCSSKYDLIFKISGRYYLNENFHISQYNTEYFNFKYIWHGEEITGVHSVKKGDCSTRLYAVPGKRLKEYKRTLFFSIIRILFKGLPIEYAITRKIKSPINYIKTLGISGNIAVDNDLKNE